MNFNNPLPNNPTFNDLAIEAFWKHWGENEKMLVTSIFSFFPQCFSTQSKEKSIIWVTFKLSSIFPTMFSTQSKGNSIIWVTFKLSSANVGKGENAGYQHFLLFPKCFPKLSVSGSLKLWSVWYRINPLPHMPILRYFNSAASKDMMSKLWKNGDTIIWFSRKHCGKRRNWSLRAISPFPTMFSKPV